MSEEQLKAFIAKCQVDATLKDKLKTAGGAEAVVQIAGEAGFVVSIEEIKQTQDNISDEELEEASGGQRNRGTDLTCWRN